jgi:hypothetical protein
MEVNIRPIQPNDAYSSRPTVMSLKARSTGADTLVETRGSEQAVYESGDPRTTSVDVTREKDRAGTNQENLTNVTIDPTSPLKYWIKNTLPQSPTTLVSTDQIHVIFQAPKLDPTAVLASTLEDADVVLEIDATGVTLRHQSLPFSHLSFVAPHVMMADIPRVFPRVFAPIARFHHFLTAGDKTTSKSRKDNVRCRLHTLLPSELDTHSLLWSELDTDVCKAGVEIEPQNGEVLVKASGEDNLHAIVLENHSDMALFPHVAWFDPANYAIQLFYVPDELAHAPLPARSRLMAKEGLDASDDKNESHPGRLQLGRSEECYDAMWFEVPSGQERDTGMLKVFLSDIILDMSQMEQEDVFKNSEHVPRERGGKVQYRMQDPVTMVITTVSV